MSEMAPTPFAPFQANLMESLEAVLWQSFADAERVVTKRKKMVLIDVSTKWTGWSNLMEKNTYTKKGIIRYLNENFYAVRLDAESNDTIVFNRLAILAVPTIHWLTLCLRGICSFRPR